MAGFFIGRATKSATAPQAVASPSPWWHVTTTSEAWRPLPTAPIRGRVGEGVVWTGTEMIVAGGVTRSGTVKPASDGAAYNPLTRTWHKIASPPPGVGAGALWTGNAAVFWTGNAPDGPAVGAVYDPRANSWRRLPAGPLGPRESYSSVWTGKELLIIGGTEGDALAAPVAAALDPRTDTWRPLPALDHLTLFGGPNGAVWDGHEALVMGNLSLCPKRGSACDRRRPIFVAYNPATDAVRKLKLPTRSADFGADQLSSMTPIAWTGTDVVFRTALAGSVRVVRYNPTTGRWTKGRFAPCFNFPFIELTQTAWIGDRYVAACGEEGLQIYSPGTDSWRTITPGPSPLNSRNISAIVWTGTDLIAWSGIAGTQHNPTPANGASLTFKK